MNMRVGGSLLYPVAPNVPNDELIYRPEYGGGGLLNNGRDFYKPGNVGSTFAGGSLLGQYYDASTNTFKPLQPSGVYTTNPEDAANIGDDTRTGGGAFTLQDLMSFEGALRSANFGEQPYESVFTAFEDMGDGTYDIRRGGSNVFNDILFGRDAEGNSVPMNLAVYGQRHARAGELLDPQLRNNMILAGLSGLDLSGGGEGTGGADGPGGEAESGADSGSGNAGGDAGESDAP